jgi:hypothetical protein
MEPMIAIKMEIPITPSQIFFSFEELIFFIIHIFFYFFLFQGNIKKEMDSLLSLENPLFTDESNRGGYYFNSNLFCESQNMVTSVDNTCVFANSDNVPAFWKSPMDNNMAPLLISTDRPPNGFTPINPF